MPHTVPYFQVAIPIHGIAYSDAWPTPAFPNVSIPYFLYPPTGSPRRPLARRGLLRYSTSITGVMSKLISEKSSICSEYWQPHVGKWQALRARLSPSESGAPVRGPRQRAIGGARN